MIGAAAGLIGLDKLRFVLLLASVGVAVLLLVLLFAVTGLGAAMFEQSLLSVPPQALLGVIVLVGANSSFSAKKWKLIAATLKPRDERSMSRPLYFAFTSIGVALGQIAPASMTLVASRSVGAHLHGGRALARGAGATLVDYFFDVLLAALLALCSVMVLITGGGGVVWAVSAGFLGITAFLLYAPAAQLAAGVAGWLAVRMPERYGEMLAISAASPVLKPAIGHRLLAISALRFAIMVTIAAIGARAIGADIPVWQIAAALPFSVIALALAITPGGLGVNEWTLASVLLAFGTPFQVSAEWALVTRILVAVAAALWGLVGLAIAVWAARMRNTGENEPARLAGCQSSDRAASEGNAHDLVRRRAR